MSGFWAWVAGPGGTLAGMSVALVVGTALGWLAATRARHVSRRERRELADAAADRAARQFRRMRQPELRERKTSTAAFLDPTPYGAVMFAAVAPGRLMRAEIERACEVMEDADRISPEVAHEAYLAHEELASEWHDHPPLKWDDEAVPGCPSCERRWETHVGAALAVANGGPIDTGEIRAITEDMDAFLEGLLAAHPVPYPDGGDQ